MLLWLLACTASDPEPGGTDVAEPSPPTESGATAPTGATGPTGSTDPDPASLPFLSEILDCEVPELPAEAGDGVGVLHRVVLPDVACNDGSPAVAYVRAALDPSRVGDWVVQLDGGSFCDSGEACAARWCGVGAYDAHDMSSRWTRETRKLGGLASSQPSNRFAGWNQVYVPYCTSDMWMGQRRDAPLETEGVRYRAHFEGARVVDAVFAAMDTGLVSDDGVEVLPPLDTADRLVLAGASAGAMGVLVHLDAVAERLSPVAVTGLVDALWAPDPAEVAAAGAGDPAFDAGYLDAMEGYRQSLYDAAVEGLFHGRLDASCATSGGAPYLCIDPGVLQRDHVSTAFATHHDLQDPVLAAQHLAYGATTDAYTRAGAAGLAELAAARPEVGVVGSLCRKHTVLGSTSWFQRMTVGEAVPVSVHDAAVAQLDGTPVVLIDDVEAATSACP